MEEWVTMLTESDQEAILTNLQQILTQSKKNLHSEQMMESIHG
jgi:hypothetical protein